MLVGVAWVFVGASSGGLSKDERSRQRLKIGRAPPNSDQSTRRAGGPTTRTTTPKLSHLARPWAHPLLLSCPPPEAPHRDLDMSRGSDIVSLLAAKAVSVDCKRRVVGRTNQESRGQTRAHEYTCAGVHPCSHTHTHRCTVILLRRLRELSVLRRFRGRNRRELGRQICPDIWANKVPTSTKLVRFGPNLAHI